MVTRVELMTVSAAAAAFNRGGGVSYAAIDGDDEADGRSWSSAKRTVSAAVESLPYIDKGRESFHAGTVIIGSGEFIEAGAIEANRELCFLGMNARSDSAGTVIKLADGANAPLFSFTESFRVAGGYSHGLKLDNLTLDANSAGQARTDSASVVTPLDTRVSVGDGSAFPTQVPFDVDWGSEIVTVVKRPVLGPWEVKRGRYGSRARYHATGVPVSYAGSCIQLVGGGFNCEMRNIHLKNAGGAAFKLLDNAVNFHAYNYNASQCGGPAFAYLPASISSGSMISFWGGQIDDCGEDAMYLEGAQSGTCHVAMHSIKFESRRSNTKHQHCIAHRPARAANDASGFQFDLRNLVAYALGGDRDSMIHEYAGANQGASWDLTNVAGKDGYRQSFSSAKSLIKSQGNVSGALRVSNFDTGATCEGDLQLGNALILTGNALPEGSVQAPVGSMYLCTGGGVGRTLWVKERGNGTVGWAAK